MVHGANKLPIYHLFTVNCTIQRSQVLLSGDHDIIKKYKFKYTAEKIFPSYWWAFWK